MNASAANGGLQSWPVNDDLPPIFDEVPAPPVPSSSSSSSSSDEDSDTSPRSRDRAARKILRHSEFYQDYMPATDDESDSMLKFCGSLLVRLPGMVVASLVRRITDYRFNWENKTLQSMLEIGCMISVTCAVYSLYHDWLFALEFGSFVGALVTIFDEVAQQCMRSIVRGIRNQSGGSELLLKLGFDIPKNGKAPTSGREIELLKTVVFGYLGLVAIQSLWTRLHDIMEFTLLTALVGVMFVMTAEFFCLWLPTRRIGLTLQSRFTRAGRNWQEHPYRSFFEIVFWTSSTIALYQTSQDFYWSARLGTIISVGVCLSSGLEELELPEVSDDEVAGLTFWQEHASTDPFLAVSDGLVKSHDALRGMWKRKAL